MKFVVKSRDNGSRQSTLYGTNGRVPGQSGKVISGWEAKIESANRLPVRDPEKRITFFLSFFFFFQYFLTFFFAFFLSWGKFSGRAREPA